MLNKPLRTSELGTTLATPNLDSNCVFLIRSKTRDHKIELYQFKSFDIYPARMDFQISHFYYNKMFPILNRKTEIPFAVRNNLYLNCHERGGGEEAEFLSKMNFVLSHRLRVHILTPV